MKKVFFGFLLGLFVAGCQTPPTDDTRISVDPALWNSVRVAPLVMDRTPDNYLVVQANVTNIKKGNCPLEYRAEFLNKNGLTIRSVMDGWTPLVLAPKETRGLTVISPTVAATECRFSIRVSAQ